MRYSKNLKWYPLREENLLGYARQSKTIKAPKQNTYGVVLPVTTFFSPEVENIEGYSAQQFLLIPQYYAGLKRVVSELSNDTKHDVVWREYRLQKWVEREHINSRQSSISGLTVLASKRNMHHFLSKKAGQKRLQNWSHCAQVCQRRSIFEVQSRHLQKHENLCRTGILKTASSEIWTGFIRKCMGPKRGAIHAQKQSSESWLI